MVKKQQVFKKWK